jgi:HlyD family secretion protein
MRHNGFRSIVRFCALLGIFVSPLIGAGCRGTEDTAVAAAPPAVQRVDVPALKVALTDIESTLQISGSLMPQARVGVTSKLPGMISRISVQIGDRIRTGQVVAILDRRELDAQVDAAVAAVNVARAGLESAEASLANAVLEHERAQNLFDKGAVPRQRLDAAATARRASSAQRDLASANLVQAEAAQRRAREVQRDATLTSPIDGVVVERNYDAGSLVTPGEKPVAVVADLRVLKLEAGVSELEAGRLRVGMPARVTVQARPGDVFEGRVAAIAPEVDARNRHFTIEVRTANPKGTLLSGMYGTAVIPLERAAQVIAVPRDAVVDRQGKNVVFLIDSGSVVREVPVTEGLTDGSRVQIASGLEAGAVIVADARRELAPGVIVNPVFAR